MPALLVESLVYCLLYLNSAAIVIIVRGLYDSLGGCIKAHQACCALCDNVFLSKSPWKLNEIGYIEGKVACGGLIVMSRRAMYFWRC
jgi:hypothetical protein